MAVDWNRLPHAPPPACTCHHLHLPSGSTPCHGLVCAAPRQLRSAVDQGQRLPTETDGCIPKDRGHLRLPVKYLANLLTADREAPIVMTLNRMIAMRSYHTLHPCGGTPSLAVLRAAGIQQWTSTREMYRYMTIIKLRGPLRRVPTGHPGGHLEGLLRPPGPERLQLRQRFLSRLPSSCSPSGWETVETAIPPRRPTSAEGGHVLPTASCPKLLDYPDEGLLGVLWEIRERMAGLSSGAQPTGVTCWRSSLDHLSPLPPAEARATSCRPSTSRPACPASPITCSATTKEPGPALIDLTEVLQGLWPGTGR